MAVTFIVKAPAKINLFLKIESRRNDGFHNLQSLFQAISIYDEISFQYSDYDLLISSEPNIPVDGRNLIWKAINLLRETLSSNKRFYIKLQKNIPHEAGLGGGSSDAAAALWAVNNMLGSPLSLSALRNLGSRIGSDVPFFLSSGTAFCSGRGEIIEELPPLPQKDYVLWIVKPPYGLSTPKVFKEFDFNLIEPRDVHNIMKQFYNGKIELFNDLELVAFKILPELEKVKKSLLSQGFEYVLMSGSGTSIFCLTKDVDLIPHQDGCEIFKTAFSAGLV